MIKLRDYQLECLDALKTSDNNSNLVVLPTGSGKTIIFLSYLIQTNKKALILVHTLDLVKQTYEVLKNLKPDFKFQILNKKTKIDENQIIISTIQSVSMGKTLERLKENEFEALIIDEAHHALSNSYLKIIHEMKFNDENKILIGFTATPVRGDGQSLSKVFKNEVYRKEIFEMIEKNILTDVIGYRIKTGVDLKGVRTKFGDFAQYELTAVVNTIERNELAVKSYEKICKDKKTLIFCVDIQHSEDLANIFRENGIHCEAVHGKLDKIKRDKLIEDFKSGKIKVLTNCQLLTEGFDCPSIESLIMARPTRSLALYLQMLGRGLRIFPTKKECILVELTDNSHSIYNLPKLVHDDAEIILEFENGESLKRYREICIDRDKNKLLSNKEIFQEQYSPFKNQNSHISTNGMATENQISILRRLGIEFIPPLSYNIAKLLIINHKRNNGNNF